MTIKISIFICAITILNGNCSNDGLIAANQTKVFNSNMTIKNSSDQPKAAQVNTTVAPQDNFSQKIGKSNAAVDFLITNNSLGKIRVGSTFKDVKNGFPAAKFKIVKSPIDNITSLIEIISNGERLFYFSTENFSEVEEVELPAETDKVFYMVTDNERFVTTEKINVGQTFGDAEKVYGKYEFFNEENIDFISFEQSKIKRVVFYSVDNQKSKDTNDENIESAATSSSENSKNSAQYSPIMQITHIGVGKNT